MGWKDALQSVRAGLAGLYPGVHARQGESPPEGEGMRKSGCLPIRQVGSLQRHQQHREPRPPQPRS